MSELNNVKLIKYITTNFGTYKLSLLKKTKNQNKRNKHVVTTYLRHEALKIQSMIKHKSVHQLRWRYNEADKMCENYSNATNFSIVIKLMNVISMGKMQCFGRTFWDVRLMNIFYFQSPSRYWFNRQTARVLQSKFPWRSDVIPPQSPAGSSMPRVSLFSYSLSSK